MLPVIKQMGTLACFWPIAGIVCNVGRYLNELAVVYLSWVDVLFSDLPSLPESVSILHSEIYIYSIYKPIYSIYLFYLFYTYLSK